MSNTGGNSRSITTTQTGPHEKLDALVKRYQQSPSQRPVSAHTQAAFDEILLWLTSTNQPLILDSCCGVGESTARLAKAFPDALVLGVDKSAQRVGKHSHYVQPEVDNYQVIRADVIDLWRLLVAHKVPVAAHYLLYPNPYPKASQVQKRWHGCAAFVDLMALTAHVEVRSNWLIYLLEFAQAAGHYGLRCDIQPVSGEQAFTPFERKYLASGQTCWQLRSQPDEAD